MLIPEFWAEATQLLQHDNRQQTIRRFGWSNQNEAEAFAMAQTRLHDAIQRLEQGEQIYLREHHAVYNGAFGVPIREEILARYDEEIISRNGYGAHCLNTPRVLFADIDFEEQTATNIGQGSRVFWALLLTVLGILSSYFLFADWLGRGLYLVVILFLIFKWSAKQNKKQNNTAQPQVDPVDAYKQRLALFLKQHPLWNIRLYRTPSGLRLMATHQFFAANDPVVKDFFDFMGVDAVYAQMCIRQQCFRARLSAKPWRIKGFQQERPRTLWPVAAHQQELRQKWIAQYEQQAAPYAACHYLEEMGSSRVDRQLASIIDLHDRESKAHYLERPIA
ncbi:hypothetical protein [Acinetobacter larvae]|uniref:Uncharacterized protein n=1 Tax=Acinetobacter larvae TaxID=1789224 RepID=A0A1B2M3L5_9GAMM|nr:hypothetical protein [Acinetobacter larvae]AOA59796.1 hypothetical protein BFG52_00120 [Acinetobacter larvae]